jgi:hypothetical protein
MSRILLTLAILSIAACDPPAAEQCPALADLALADPQGFEAPAISLREQGPPMGSYITQLGGDAITRDGFVKLIHACAEQVDPPLTCTLSWYQPDIAKNEWVMGLGCSALVPEALWSCYRQVFDQQGGVNF